MPEITKGQKNPPPPTSTTIAEELNLINVPPDNVQRFPKGFPNLPFANSIVDRCRAGIDLDSLMLAQERAWRVSKNKKKNGQLNWIWSCAAASSFCDQR